MTKRNTGIAIVAVVLLAVALFFLARCSSADPESVAESTSEASDTETDAPEEESVPTPEVDSLYTATYEPNGTEIAMITTPKGVIKFEFFVEDAPNHVASFIERAQDGFYDGTKFHRVEPNFVIQGGDPLSKTDDPNVGTGGPGYVLGEEFNDRLHLEGTVAMARSMDPNSGGSQFYICLSPQPSLDGQYTVFGQVTEGLDVVHAIAVGDVMESMVIENAN